MINGNDGSHGYGGGYARIRGSTLTNSGVRTEGRPKRITLRSPLFCKHKFNETRVIDLVSLGGVVINGFLA